MLLIDKIKEDQVQARKTRTDVAAKILTTLLGESSMIGKNAGRDTTDDEVISVIKKFIKGIDETSSYVQDIYIKDVLVQEKEILSGYLPVQLSDDTIKSYLMQAQAVLHDGLQENKGVMMKYLKENFNGQYDGKSASIVIDEILLVPLSIK